MTNEQMAADCRNMVFELYEELKRPVPLEVLERLDAMHPVTDDDMPMPGAKQDITIVHDEDYNPEVNRRDPDPIYHWGGGL